MSRPAGKDEAHEDDVLGHVEPREDDLPHEGGPVPPPGAPLLRVGDHELGVDKKGAEGPWMQMSRLLNPLVPRVQKM